MAFTPLPLGRYMMLSGMDAGAVMSELPLRRLRMWLRAFRAANREFVYTGKDIMISYTESFAKFQENEANLRPPIVYSDAINHRFR